MPDAGEQLRRNVPQDYEDEEQAWLRFYKYHRRSKATAIFIEFLKGVVKDDRKKVDE